MTREAQNIPTHYRRSSRLMALKGHLSIVVPHLDAGIGPFCHQAVTIALISSKFRIKIEISRTYDSSSYRPAAAPLPVGRRRSLLLQALIRRGESGPVVRLDCTVGRRRFISGLDRIAEGALSAAVLAPSAFSLSRRFHAHPRTA